jgi:hypothetical protein
VTRGRLIQLFTLVVVAGLVLRLSGLVEIPGTLLVGAIVLDILLGLVEAGVFVYLGRPIYLKHRRTLEPFDAFIETLREIELFPKPLFALVERELRAYHRAYRAARGRRAGE